jgi:hypothetical protein
MMSAFYYFPHHWSSYIESLARASYERSGSLGLPEAREIVLEGGQKGIAVEVGDGYEKEARSLFGGIPLGPNPPEGSVLSSIDLLARLPWQPRPVRQRSGELLKRESRLLVRIQAQAEEDFRADFEGLRNALYAVNTTGMREVIASATMLQDTPDGYAHDALVFVARLPSTMLHYWLEERLKSPREKCHITLYRPYEPVIATDQEGHPRGVWLPDCPRVLPYLGLLAEDIRRGEGGQVVLAEEMPKGDTLVIRVGGYFLPLYFFSEFDLTPRSSKISEVRAVPQVRKPFLVQLRLNSNADRSPQMELTRESLHEAERQIGRWQAKLKREARYVRFLKRRLEYDESQVISGNRQSALAFLDRTPRKYLYLFFETHTGDPGAPSHWPFLQELLLTSSFQELRNLRYAYLQFAIHNPKTQKTDEIAFHLVGCGTGENVEGTPDTPPPGLQNADLVFEQDPDWRLIGYNLYVPVGYYLFPPLRPLDAAPRTGFPEQATDDDDPRCVPLSERCLFNDLWAQAVFAPEGIMSSVEAQERLERFRDWRRDQDNICLILRDPASDQLLPIFLYRSDFKPLSAAAPVLLNQAGLMAGPTMPIPPKGPIVGTQRQVQDRVSVTLRRIAAEVPAAIQERFEKGTLGFDADALAEHLHRQMVQLLDQSLARRYKELNDERERRERVLREEANNQALALKDLQEEWKTAREKLERASETLKKKIRAAQRIFGLLEERASEVEAIGIQGAKNWEGFVQQVVAVAHGLQIEAEGLIQEAEQRIQKADKDLEQTHQNVIGQISPRLDQQAQSLEEIGRTFEGKTANLEWALAGIAQSTAALRGSREAVLTHPTPDLARQLVAARQEIDALRQQLHERETNAANQRRELEAELRRERQKAARVESLERELQQRKEERSKRERELDVELKKNFGEVHNLKKELKDTRLEAQRAREEQRKAEEDREREVSELQRQIGLLQSELATTRQAQEELILTGQSFDVPLIRKRFEALASIVDHLHAAEYQFAKSHLPDHFAQGSAIIREAFYHLFEVDYQVQRVPITPGQTLFDPNLPHHAVAKEWNPALSENVILRIIRDGYTRGGYTRDAFVVINQREIESK